MTQAECLQAVVERVRELAGRGTRPVVLLDLDDTILSTTRRHARILREFAAETEVAERWPEAAGQLSVLEPPPHAYSVVDIARAARVEGTEVLSALKEFWFERFFRSEYVLEDAPVPGAPEFCRTLAEAGAVLAYVTGRDEAMRPGTEISLAQKGFPVPGRGDARLVLKPRFDTPDLQFKHEALERVAEWGPVAAGFENEPAHINLFADRFPGGRMVLVQTKHSGKPIDPLPTVGRIRDFLLTA
ncbi:MAG: HAD family hydrolase [Elusimicrobia bacterium]|nr:HAD family hydrolase [Elusimicrobiota bacterium]